MYYRIHACVTRSLDGWNHFRTLPAFFLYARNEQHAHVLAREIINPLVDNDLDIEIIITVPEGSEATR